MKMFVTLEITVEADSRDDAFSKVETLLGSAEFLLYDAEAAEPPDLCPRCGGVGSVRNDGFISVQCLACKGKGTVDPNR